MATLCTNCRTPLRDDAKFCNNCGTLVPSHPFSPKATSSSNSGPVRSDNNRPIIREQTAHFPQNTARPVRRFVPDEPPSWMSRLDGGNKDSTNRTSSNGYEADTTPQLDFPVPEPLPRPNTSQRELHVKVWKQEEPVSSPGLSRQDPDTFSDEEMDNLPTSPLVASSSNAPAARNATFAPSRAGQDSRVDDLEHMDTAHLAAPAHMPSSQSTLHPSREAFDQSFAFAQQPTSSLARGTVQEAAPQRPQRYESAFSHPTAQPAQSNGPVSRATQSQPLRQTPPSHASIASPRRKQGRKPLVFVVGLLVILLLGGIGVWVGVFHPFSVPDVVQPQQSFSNSQLAFSVQYPSGWNTRVDTATSSAYFTDSSNTAQFTVTVSPANGKDAGQYAQQLATQMKMTNIKPGSSLSFGGVSWQQVQGNALFGGANYSETILVTAHANQLYIITQAAPQSTYAQEEQIVFSTMRTSFKFV